MIKTEVTVQIFDTLDNAINILKSKGYKEVEQFRINDYYFSKYSSEELKKMDYIKIIDNSLIVREMIDDTPNRKIFYKKKTLDDNGNVVGEEKYSIKIESSYTARNIFKMSGLNEWCKLGNTSYVYKLDDYSVAIQNIDKLGLFVVFKEYPALKDLTNEEKFNKIKENVDALGLKTGDDYSVKKPYLMLMKED